MANENMTVEQVCENTINYKLNKHQSKMKFSGVDLHECEVELCTKILAAHKREILDIREKCMHQAIVLANGKDEVIAKRDALIKELYDVLHEAVIEMCHNCNPREDGEEPCPLEEGDCFVQRWRKALAKAAGKEEAK